MRKYFYYLCIAMLCVGVVGCTNNDNNGNNNENNDDKLEIGDDFKSLIIGLWEAEKDWEEGKGYEEWDDGELVLRFKKDGTGFWMMEDEEDDVDSFEWEVDGNILYFYEDGEVDDYAKIEKLTNSELILSYEGGTYKEYYTRAN